MKSANISLSKYYNLLPDSKINEIAKMNKHDRNVYVGILQKDKKFAKDLSNAFKSMRKEFFYANKLSDDNVLSIKKDAIFVIGKRCKHLFFGDSVKFEEKNVYTSFHRLNNLEFYYSASSKKIDVKGINDDSLPDHKYFLNILKRLFQLLDEDRHDDYIKFLRQFVLDYRNRNLSYEYYKELRSNGGYTLDSRSVNNTGFYEIDKLDETIHDRLNINYNYIAYILPMIQRHYFDFKI